jgi:mono/diheme cytochrome c family protein
MKKWQSLVLGILVAAISATGCGGGGDAPVSGVPDAAPPGDVDATPLPPDAAPSDQRAKYCPPARSADRIPQRLGATAANASSSFAALRLEIHSTCTPCHQAPALTGGFTYQDAYRGGDMLIDGQHRYVPGLSEVAPRMATALLAQRMPPAEIRQGDPPGYLRLGSRLEAWIAAGLPEQAEFPLPDETVGGGQQLPPAIAAAMTDLGDCVPLPEVIGTDAPLDAKFAALDKLPATLAETDLVSLDAYELARRGTVGYDVEYPLWADNAHKGRWVHVPSAPDAMGVTRRQPIRYDAPSGHFDIPDDTRFYKTFFKQVKEADGEIRYRKVETRLIVVRHAPRTPLFGTYLWDDAEASATLHTLPYRSGDPFKDDLLSLETDVTTHERRTYAVPAAHRCNECHQGSESDSFVLGFTPLQIHRRALGEAGRETPTLEDELGQLDRLVAYGVVAEVTNATAPGLEHSNAAAQPRNDYELRFQAYTTGNCAHCHNPKGFATRQNPALTMNLAPGGNVFQFPPSLASIYSQSGNYIKPGAPDRSLIFQRMSKNTHLEGAVPLMHMPLHTPGIDCDAVNLVGKWITSIPTTGSAATPAELEAAMAAAQAFTSDCRTQPDITWLEEDFTEPPVYVPRRADWNDAVNGIPALLRAQEFTPALQDIARTPIALGYWIKKPQCQFPEVASPEGGTRPWMLRPDGTPKRPFGEVFYQTPGAAYFTNVCQKCHGPRANGETGIAKTILFATGGQTRVANLHDGLFGHAGANLALFDVLDPTGTVRNLAGNYLIWMASGGTHAYFPPELEPIVGPNGGNMLNLVRQTCAQLLPGHPNQMLPSYQIYEVYAKVCSFENPIAPELGFQPGTTVPLHPELQKAWLDRAAQNAGWMIFRFLKEDAATDHWPLTPNDCETQYPATPGTP